MLAKLPQERPLRAFEVATEIPASGESNEAVRMDVFIAGIARAGTTLVANLLTRPPTHWLIVEPGITRKDMGEHVRVQAERFGIRIPKDQWDSFKDPLERFRRLLLPRLNGVRWGVKEVNPAGWDELNRDFRPRATLLCVRDMRDCALSMFEKHQRSSAPGQDETWMLNRLLDASRALLRVKQLHPSESVRVIRYQDFVTNPDERSAIAEWLDWPLDGDPGWCLDVYGRENEKVKHSGKIGSGSVGRGERGCSPAASAFVERVIEQAAEYQSAFGYGERSRQFTGVSPAAKPACTSTSTSSPGRPERVVEMPMEDAALDHFVGSLSDEEIVVVPDSENPAYDSLKARLYEIEHVGFDPQTRKHVWRGGIRQRPSCPTILPGQELPTIVCFYTLNTGYAEAAARLESSCRELGVPHAIEGVPNRGSWEFNCAYKSKFMLAKWRELKRPIMWVDADAVLRRAPCLLAGVDADFGIHKIDRWEFASGTLFFNQTENALRLLESWVAHCENAPAVWDQNNLDGAWEEIVSRYPLKTLWLPQSYTRIFDRDALPGEDPEPVVEHFQASRSLKAEISNKPHTPPRELPQNFIVVRSASRTFRGELSRLAAELFDQGNWDEAGRVYQQLTRLMPDDRDAWLRRLECTSRQGHKVMAERLREEILKRHPEWAVEIAAASAANPSFENEQSAGAAIPIPFAAELDLWIDEYLSVAGEGTVFAAGPFATEIVGRLLRRGIVAQGVDTRVGAPETAFDEQCLAGTLDDAIQVCGPVASMLLIGAVDEMDDDALRYLLAQAAKRVSGTVCVRVLSRIRPHRTRHWWEQVFLDSGFRKHPQRSQVLPFDQMDAVQPLALFFERIAEDPSITKLSSYSMADPSRSSGREADLAMLPYELAAPLVRPWDTVLDIACGCGTGTNLLRRATRAGQVIGCSQDAGQIDNAIAHFGAHTVEFRVLEPADVLLQLEEGSVDFAVLAPPLSEPDALDGLLQAAGRILAPGGRLVLSLGAENRAVNQQKLRSCRHAFLNEMAWRVSVETAAVQRISVDDFGAGGDDTWIVVLMKDPICRGEAAYRETAFRHVAGGSCAGVLNYPEFYEDPWILHSLVHAGIRLNAPGTLAQTAHRLLLSTAPTSADAGAALCILLYRAMDGPLPETVQTSDVEARAEAYLGIGSPNAHQFRWQVSLTYALGQLAMRRGDLATARKWFIAVGQMDVFKWGPSLATKTTEALFLAGWLAWCAGEAEESKRHWSAGIEFGRKLLARPLDETLLNPEFPSVFDYGDGMRELIYALENVAMCANGLHGLKLREQGIPFRWDLIHNSFRTQRERGDRLLRQAQERVTGLCREIDGVRAELRQRTEELDALRIGNEFASTVDAVMDRLR